MTNRFHTSKSNAEDFGCNTPTSSCQKLFNGKNSLSGSLKKVLAKFLRTMSSNYGFLQVSRSWAWRYNLIFLKIKKEINDYFQTVFFRFVLASQIEIISLSLAKFLNIKKNNICIILKKFFQKCDKIYLQSAKISCLKWKL